MRARLTGASWAPERQEILEEARYAVAPNVTERTMLLLYWLRFIVTYLRKCPERAHDNRWMHGNVERVPNPNSEELEGLWDQEWQRNLLETSIVRVKKRVSAKQYQMFNLYVMMQWPMNQVKKTLGVSAAQVYMAKMRVSRLIKSEVRTLEKKMI